MYHLSDIKNMERCTRLYHLTTTNKLVFHPYMINNLNIVDLLKEYMMINDCFVGERNDDPTLAINAYQEGKHLINARFAYGELRVKVPLLIQEDGKHLLYMVYQSIGPKESEGQRVADLLWVLNKINIQIDEVYAISINPKYVREETLNVHELFSTTNYFYRPKNKPGKLIMDCISECERDLEPLLAKLKTIKENECPQAIHSSSCTRGLKCRYYDECFPLASEGSIEHLYASANKYEMKERGIQRLKDVDLDSIEGYRQQFAQIMADRLGGLFYDYPALKVWLDSIDQSTISYLDFEWETYLYPPYKGMKPYEPLVFQYSLHVEKDGQLTHYEYIGEGDCRKAFLESLLNVLPKEGSILVYNMEGAEKLRLKQLANYYPEYTSEIDAICERMIDLALPFETGNIYDIRYKNSYSLKTLVSVYSDKRYSDLAISNGLQAVEVYQQYKIANDELKATYYQQLSEYCALDTYGEYIVFHALKTLLGGN